MYYARKDSALKAEESTHNMKLGDRMLKVSFFDETIPNKVTAKKEEEE